MKNKWKLTYHSRIIINLRYCPRCSNIPSALMPLLWMPWKWMNLLLLLSENKWKGSSILAIWRIISILIRALWIYKCLSKRIIAHPPQDILTIKGGQIDRASNIISRDRFCKRISKKNSITKGVGKSHKNQQRKNNQ